MYKTKLQELCQQKLWNLPEYSTTKEGRDHDPRFQATVTINGHSFNTLSPAKSSKKAQNDAAKLAFEHFSLPPPPTASSSTPLASYVSTTKSDNLGDKLTSGGATQLEVQETNVMSQGNEPAIISKIDDKYADVEHLYKSLLQNYAHKKGLTLPVYSCERVGPLHASRFKCNVTIEGQTYDSQEFFPTLSKAEHAAAKVALMSLAPNGVEEDESAYKNLLQELAQKECYRMPIYSTVRSGEAHHPTFVSTVDIEGKLFTGMETRTKKQAELSAAKIAYTALKQRNSGQSPPTSSFSSSSSSPMVSCSANLRRNFDNSSQSAPNLSPPHQRQKVAESPCSSWYERIAYLQKNVQPRLPAGDEQPMEDKESSEVRSEACPIVSEVISYDCKVASSGQPSCASSGPALLSLHKPCLSSSSLPSDSSTNLAAISTPEHAEVADFSCYDKVIVHPRSINMTYPPGSTVLSMSDDKWVAVGISTGLEKSDRA